MNYILFFTHFFVVVVGKQINQLGVLFFLAFYSVNGSYFSMVIRIRATLLVLLLTAQYYRPFNRLLRLEYPAKTSRNKLVRRLLVLKGGRARRSNVPRLTSTVGWLPAECCCCCRLLAQSEYAGSFKYAVYIYSLMKNFHSNIFIIAGFSHALPFPMQISLFFSFLLHSFFWAPSSSLSSSSSLELSRLEHKSNKRAHNTYLLLVHQRKKEKKKKTFFPLVLLLNIMRFSYLNIIRLFARRFLSFW